MLTKIIAAATTLLLLCSCNTVSLSGTESLLVAPKLNKQQTDVTDAFESTLSMRGIVYKPPQGGENRSPFIFYDVDGDGRDEAIVFYAYSNENAGSVRAKILVQNERSKWSSISDITSPTQGTEIEFVQFKKMLSPQATCVIIGWSGATINKPSALSIYSMKDHKFREEAVSEYLSYSIDDFDSNGIFEVVTVGQDTARDRFAVSLLRGNDERIETTSSIDLASDVGSTFSLLTGKLWDGSRALYIDELLFGSTTLSATEIIRVTANELTVLAGGEPVSRDAPENPARANYEFTFRDGRVPCMDIDRDGIVEVPNLATLPGPLEATDTITPNLVHLMRLSPDGFDITDSAVINNDAGYLVHFPERWLDTVTVEIDKETSEWHFRKWNETTGEPAEELLRIRVSTEAGDLDIFGEYETLETKATTTYSAYIPKLVGEPLAVTKQEVLSMFKLLP